MKWEIPTPHLLPHYHLFTILLLRVNAAIKLYVGGCVSSSCCCCCWSSHCCWRWHVACGVWHVAYGWWCYAFFLYSCWWRQRIMLKEHCTLYIEGWRWRYHFTGALSYSPLSMMSSTTVPGVSTTLGPNATDSQQQRHRMSPRQQDQSHWAAVASPPGSSDRRPTSVLCCRHATIRKKELVSHSFWQRTLSRQLTMAKSRFHCTPHWPSQSGQGRSRL